MKRRALASVVVLLALAAGPAARAEFLDWTDVSWTAGSLGPVTYTGGDLGAASVTVTVTDPSSASSPGTPTLVSGVNGFDRSFRISPNFGNSGQSMRAEYQLGAPVTQLTFSLGDIDTGSDSSPYANWQDVAVVTAFSGGVEVAVTIVSTGTFVGVDTSNSWTTGLNAVVYGTRNLDESQTTGNASFRVDGPVDLLRVDYRPGNATDGIPGEGPAAPNNQWVHIHDLVFLAAADLSLAKVASTTTPTVGSTVTYTLTLTNGGPAAATGVRVADVLPVGLSYVAGTIAGGTARNAAGAPTLTWDQATLASGASTVLTYEATVNAPTGAANEYRNAAQVTVAPQPDPDSTPNNGATNGEDDRAQVTLTPALPVSGFVYEDADHDSTRDGTEVGTGLTLYAKLVPSATPAGPASQVVAVTPATGAFSFAAVAPGTYSIVIDTSNTAADVTPTFPSGWLPLEESDWIRSVTVASAAITGQNYGLYHGSRVQGVVFNDNGAGGGTANDGVRNGTEPGLNGVTVNPTAAGCGGSCGSTTTAGGGAFTLWIPFAADGQTVTVTETNLAGYASTGGSAGTSGGAYTLATDSVAFTHTSGSSITGLAFGDRQGADLSLTKVASTTTPAVGATVTYTITLTNGGPLAANNITVADVLPPGVSYVAGSIAGGSSRSAAGNPTLTWTRSSNLASGASIILTYQATVNAPTGAANEYRNAAQVTASNQLDPDSTPNNGVGNGEDDQATVTLTPPGTTVSGVVYEDLDHDSTRDGGETGTGLTLYAKLVPSASPAGPASQVVAVMPATGAFSFTGVAAGTYSIVIDNSNGAADVTPTFPSDWLRLEESDWVRSVTVVASSITGQDFGLYHGSRVQGVVYHDNGAGGGTAGNGVRDGSEPGLASVTVNPTATGCGGSCGSTTTDAAGAFTVWIPFAANGQTVTVTETNPSGYVSSGGSAGTSGGTYAIGTDSVAFTHSSGSDVTGLAYGDQETADLSLAKLVSDATPVVGSTVTYTLTLTNAGPATATGVSVADVLPAGVTYVAGSIAGGTSQGVALPTLTWNVASLASGASTNLTFQSTLDAPTGAPGEYDNLAQVTAAVQPDPDSTPDNGTSNAEDDRADVTIAPELCAVTLAPDRSATASAAQTVYFAHVLVNTGNASDTFDLASITSGGFTPSPIAYYRDLGVVGVYEAGTDVLLTDTDGDTIPDTGALAAAASIDLLVAATAPNAALSGSADVATTATSSLGASCSGTGAAFATATDTLSAGAGISGFVYADANHDATRNAGEAGTALTLYAKLIPAATPAGPASQVVVVDPGTGAFAFTTVTAGDWILVYDTSNAAADVSPTLPAGWLRTEESDATRTVTLGSTQITGQNFGLFRGSRVEGIVFDDDGTGGGVAGNGLLDGTEGGLAGVAVRAEASGCGGACDTDMTDAAGAFALWIPFAADGQAVSVIETNAAGFVSTGGSAGTTGGSYVLATDTLTFPNATGTIYMSVRFADFSGSGFAPNHQRAAMPGTAVFYPHVFSAGPSGSVRFSASNSANPALAGWAQSIFHDTDCSVSLDASEPQLQPADAIAVGAGGLVCIVLRESVPPGAPSGAQDLVTVTADFTAAGGASASFDVTDLTTVGLPSGLALEKSVDKTSAEPGEVLAYTITYRNDGAAPITQLVIGDATPSFTTFVPASAACGALPPNLSSCTPAPPGGPTGSVTWTFGGALAPGASGTVTYSVTIDP